MMKWIGIVGLVIVGLCLLLVLVRSLVIRILFHKLTHERCPKCGDQMVVNPVNLIDNAERIALDNGKVPQLINCPLWTCRKCGHTRRDPPVTRAPRPVTITMADLHK